MEIFNLSVSENLNNSYLNYLNELRQDSMNEDDTTLLSEDFIHDFKKIINNKSLDTYKPKSFYWLNLIDQIVDTIDVTEGMLEGELTIEDAIDFLEGSEFLGLFLEDDSNPEENLKNIIAIQELQIISFFWLHINEEDTWEPEGPVAYRPVPELGEGEGRLFLGPQNNAYIYPVEIFNNVLPVIAYNPSNHTVEFDNEGETVESKKQEDCVVSFNGFSKRIDLVRDLQHREKIKKALERIERCHPKLYEFLFRFSSVIIPVNENGIVSYSMDTLPGFSCINTYDRDFVDLLDDLIHENGHHYLNSMIEGQDDLIIEDDDKIFYSPWRRALRPVRGLYHAVGTFYWAFELFKELRNFENLFSKDEMIKIHRRFVEESYMILKCKDQLAKAYEMNKITDYGYKFINSLVQNVYANESETSSSEQYVKSADDSTYKELQIFKETIDQAQQSFR